MTSVRRTRRAALAWVLVAVATIGLVALARARRAAADVPLSPLTAAGRVGPDWPERRGVVADGPPPVGEMDDMGAYVRPGFGPDEVHPDVRRFYERTSEYDMTFVVRWHRGFRLGARLVAPLTTRLEQLNLPGRSGERVHLHSRFRRVVPDADPRTDARAWVRTDDEGRGVFVAVYARHERDGEAFTNIAVPLPRANLSTVLRWRHHDGDAAGTGVELTTRAAGDPGLYLRTPPSAIRLPLEQRFRVWPAGADDAPTSRAGGDPTLVARHEMWVCGRQFLTLDYSISRE